jgi:Flp pilus assembly protein TadG
MRSLLKIFLELADDRRGVVAIVFAMLLTVIIVSVGIGIDYTTSATVRTQLQNATDAAAIAGARAASSYLSTNGYSSSTIPAASTTGSTAATNAFNANVQSLTLASSATASPTMAITSTSNISAVVAATAVVPTSFMSIVGVKQVTVSASSSSIASLGAQYFQFIFLVDVSGSMAIGGTAADIIKLDSTYYSKFSDSTQCQKTKTSQTQCAFACHDPNNVYPCSSYPDYKARRTTATSKGINLKIDYITNAMTSFLSTVNSSLITGQSATASIYTFATNFSTVASKVTLTSAKNSVANIQIETIDPSNNWGYTNTTSALKSLAAKLTNVGDGTTSSAPKTYVVFLTDGLEDNSGSCSNYGRCTGVSYTSACTTVKNTGATLIAIEATYPVVTGDQQYNDIVAPYATSMGTAMSTCASSNSWYFSASDGTAITAAMATAVQQITDSIRLSQ